MPVSQQTSSGWWPHAETIDPLPQAPLHVVLRWILVQINSGSFSFLGDGDEPPAHTLTASI